MAFAQTTAVGRFGDDVRFTATANTSSTANSQVNCEGEVSGYSLDTVLIRPIGYCRRFASLIDLTEVEVGRDRGSRPRHVLKGLLLGIVAGGVAGFLIAGDGCQKGFQCDDGGLAVVEFTATGMTVGGLVGGIVGASLPAGLQWRPMRARPARIDAQQ